MDAKTITKAMEELSKGSKRNFSQSYDLLISLKELNLKKPEEQVEFFANLPHTTGKQVKVCALVGPELADEAKAADTAVKVDEFSKLKKPEIKRLAGNHDYFLGQANIMPKIAQTFGRVLGPRGKMPNPKGGCIVPPKAALKPLIERLQKTIKVSVKKQPNIQARVGTQGMKPDEVVQNILALYDQVVHHLPKEHNNVKAVYLKLTMSKPVKLG